MCLKHHWAENGWKWPDMAKIAEKGGDNDDADDNYNYADYDCEETNGIAFSQLWLSLVI